MDRKLLIADDDLLVRNTLGRYFRSRQVAMASSVAEAMSLMSASHRWCGAIIDYQFPDGDGLSVLRTFRQHVAHAPVLLFTGVLTPEVIHRATELGAQYVLKPAPPELFKAFAKRLGERTAPAEVAREVEGVAKEFELSPGEARVVQMAVEGVGRDELALCLGVAESTIKSYVGNIVAKCDVFQLNDVVRIVWERAAKPKP
ncbi:MAG: response regulator [Polyangiales bacterium]